MTSLENERRKEEKETVRAELNIFHLLLKKTMFNKMFVIIPAILDVMYDISKSPFA